MLAIGAVSIMGALYDASFSGIVLLVGAVAAFAGVIGGAVHLLLTWRTWRSYSKLRGVIEIVKLPRAAVVLGANVSKAEIALDAERCAEQRYHRAWFLFAVACVLAPALLYGVHIYSAKLQRDSAAAVGAVVPDPTLASLVGDWKLSAQVHPSNGLQRVSFQADGTCAFNTDPCRFTVPAPGRLSLIDGADLSETDFMIDGNRLVIAAFLPQGKPLGFVGTWTNNSVKNGVTGSISITVRGDDTATLTRNGNAGQNEIIGTVASESTGFAFTANGQVLFHFSPLGANKALGYLLFDKQ